MPEFLKSSNDVHIKAVYKGFELYGQSEVVQREKINILKAMAYKIVEKYLDRTSEGVTALLSKATVKARIQECFPRESIVAAYIVQGKDVKVYTLKQSNVNTAIDIIKSEFKEKVVQLDEAIRNCLQSSEYRSLESDLKRDFHNFEITTDKATFTVSAVKGEFDQIISQVDEFFEKNAISEKFVALKLGVVEFLEKYHVNEIDQIRRDLRDMNVDLKLVKGRNSKSGCTVFGNSAGVKRAEEDLKRLTTKVKTKVNIKRRNVCTFIKYLLIHYYLNIRRGWLTECHLFVIFACI